jgi:hypothetical protein
MEDSKQSYRPLYESTPADNSAQLRVTASQRQEDRDAVIDAELNQSINAGIKGFIKAITIGGDLFFSIPRNLRDACKSEEERNCKPLLARSIVFGIQWLRSWCYCARSNWYSRYTLRSLLLGRRKYSC